MSINRNAFAGKLLDARYKLFVELAIDQPVSGLFMGQDSRTQDNVYVRLLSGPEQDYANYAESVENCLGLKDQRIVSIVQYGRTEDLVYYIVPIEVGLSQYRTLADVLRQEGSLSPKRALNIASQLAAGLEHAALKGVIHGNLSPKSILLSGDEQQGEQVKIWDFGTAAGVLSPYTARYSAPERLNGQPADVRSDIYSLGVILYEICTGHLPILAVCDDTESWKLSHNRATPRSCKEAQPSVPDSLAALVMDCLKKEPARRPQSMNSLFQILCTPKRPSLKVRSEQESSRQKPQAALAAGLIGAVVLGSSAWGISQGFVHKQPSTPTPVSQPQPIAVAPKVPVKSITAAKPPAPPKVETVVALLPTPKPRLVATDLPKPKKSKKSEKPEKSEKAPRRRIATASAPTIVAPLRFAPEPVEAALKSSPHPVDTGSGLKSSPHPVSEVASLRGAPTPLKP
jgi:eukaryotic-like serine/threonine-protein kinase